MNARLVKLLPVLLAGLILGACGGGGGGPSPSPAPPSNNWDSMIWDQGNWG